MRPVLALTGALLLSACGSGAESPTPTGSPAAEACPEYPQWNVNIDFVEGEGHPSPEAAVRAVAGDEIEVRDVRTTGRSSQVEVRLASDGGVFSVQRVDTGWLVNGGDGCAAWAAYEVVGGPDEECLDSPPTPPSHLKEGDTFSVVCVVTPGHSDPVVVDVPTPSPS